MEQPSSPRTLLFLDDLRNPFRGANGKLPFAEYDVIYWAKDFLQFQLSVSVIEKIDIVSFDHDLHPEHYVPEYLWNDYLESKHYQDNKKYTEKTGYDCAKYLLDFCITKRIKFPEWYVHSDNPVGADKIKYLIKTTLKQVNFL